MRSFRSHPLGSKTLELFVYSTHVWVPPGALKGARATRSHVTQCLFLSRGAETTQLQIQGEGCTACWEPDHGGLGHTSLLLVLHLSRLPGGRRLTRHFTPLGSGGVHHAFPIWTYLVTGSQHLLSRLLTSCLQSSPQTESRGCSVYWMKVVLGWGGPGCWWLHFPG